MTETQVKEIMLEKPVRKDAFQITLKRFYTDVNGVIVDKTDPGIPAGLLVDFPVWLFGEFDRKGAYYLGLKNFPPEPTSLYLCAFVYGISNPLFFGFSGLSDIQLQLKYGDLVTVFTDSLTAPTYFVWIVQSSPNKPLASFSANLPNLNDELRSMSFDYYTDNELQWDETLQWITYDYTGLVKSNNIEPNIYRTPFTPQIGFIQVKWETPINQYLGLNLKFLYATDSITLNFQFKIKK